MLTQASESLKFTEAKSIDIIDDDDDKKMNLIDK